MTGGWKREGEGEEEVGPRLEGRDEGTHRDAIGEREEGGRRKRAEGPGGGERGRGRSATCWAKAGGRRRGQDWREEEVEGGRDLLRLKR